MLREEVIGDVVFDVVHVIVTPFRIEYVDNTSGITTNVPLWTIEAQLSLIEDAIVGHK